MGKDFDGVLAWGWIGKRPFLRSDNQSLGFLVEDVRAKVAWENSKNR
jgi:hypothetical protein